MELRMEREEGKRGDIWGRGWVEGKGSRCGESEKRKRTQGLRMSGGEGGTDTRRGRDN